MFYLQKFQNNRQDYLRYYQHLQLVDKQNFSLCSNQYSEKYPKVSQLATPYNAYSRNQTLFFLSRMSSLPMKSTNDNQQQTHVTRDSKVLMPRLFKQSKRDETTERLSNRWYNQPLNNASQLISGNQSSNTRSTTAPLILEDSARQAISARIKSSIPSRPGTSQLIKSSNTLISSASILQCGNQPELDTYTSLDLSVETITNDQDESKILHRDSQCKMNGFQHIANLGSWQRSLRDSKHEIEKDNDSSSSKLIYEYKSPFTREYDHAIAIQGQFQTNPNLNEWDLKEFYRDVKTDFEPETNTKAVFEKCLKLARLQANTIKWEQRRRQNLNTYNRLVKTTPLDNNNPINFNGSFSLRNNNEKDFRELNELKRELRCNECKRVACLGNCAPGQEYHQYKRFVPFSSPLVTTREQIRCKLNLRTPRTTTDLRPRSTQPIVRETKLNPVIVVPLFQDDAQAKRLQKRLPNNYLPGKSFRSQRKETLTLISTHKILS